ncbi:NFACT family protein [Candidatus Woesearchaeota archaeon]|nr:NFACT family protein [Candidatus Woesearchaeota archaeon]MBW3005649.1 NFACT family protein [Candidatus Woesearchaeota archaeon]
MKKELSSVEIKYLVDEFQQLLDGKIDKIYQPAKKELLFSLHIPRIGKKMLRVILPGFIWLTETKPEMPEKMLGFCGVLRKYLSSARLRKVEQIGSERIIKLEFETKESKYDLILELFSKGNAILCQKGKIIQPLTVQKWKDRTIKKGEIYDYPSREHDPFNISAAKFKRLIETSSDTISKTLAVQLGIGGTYAAELCIMADIPKTKKNPTAQEIKKIYEKLSELLQQKIAPVVVYEDNEVIDITPFKLKLYETKRQESFKTYSQALDSILSKGIEKKELKQVSDKFGKEIGRIDTKIKIQKDNLLLQEKKAKEFQEKGEKIYEKYQELKTLFSEIQKMKKTMNWQEIKDKLKKVKYIKQINEKTGEIIIEIK